MSDGYAIVYMRPDGWWCAGCVVDDEAQAIADSEAHDWGPVPSFCGDMEKQWKVVPVGSPEYEQAHPNGEHRDD